MSLADIAERVDRRLALAALSLAHKLPNEGDEPNAEPRLFDDDACPECGAVYSAAQLAAFRDEACDETAMPACCDECAEEEVFS